jgi:hypothetical protein
VRAYVVGIEASAGVRLWVLVGGVVNSGRGGVRSVGLSSHAVWEGTGRLKFAE